MPPDLAARAAHLCRVVSAVPADDLIELLALTALDAEVVADSYRALALAALDLLSKRDAEIDRLRERHHALIDEYRRVRESIFPRGAAA